MTTKISLVSILHHSYFKTKIIFLVMRTFKIHSLQFSSVTQSCLTHFNPVDCSTSGFPVHCQLPEPTHTHVHQVSDDIQPSHPLSSPSPPGLQYFSASGSFPMSQFFT